MGSADIAVIGLAVMGQNLVLNMNDHGYKVAVYNRSSGVVKDFIEGPAKDKSGIFPAASVEELTGLVQRPRKIMLMVKAGEVVDRVIEQILPFLEEGDIIIDGGNSSYLDSTRRTRDLGKQGILFVGSGISGGEEGARLGPSIMPGGNFVAWKDVKPIFQDISARADGEPCCDWVGSDGAGHFVKMVHNGIEYGDMQLIGEIYSLMSGGLGLNSDEISDIFDEWNKGELNSYLVEITRDILRYKENGEPLVEKILDTAEQKGTGKLSGISSMELGVPLSLIAEAVYGRFLSGMKEERTIASNRYASPRKTPMSIESQVAFIASLGRAMLASKIISYTQGFMLMKEMADTRKWQLNYGSIALMWRGGCIIRSTFLGKIKEAFDTEPGLSNLLLDDYFSDLIKSCLDSWREVAMKAIEWGIPIPTISSSLAFFDGYRSEHLPANLLQAQRDYFGAHTYERIDRPRGEYFHTNWTGKGGNVSASNYSV